LKNSKSSVGEEAGCWKNNATTIETLPIANIAHPPFLREIYHLFAPFETKRLKLIWKSPDISQPIRLERSSIAEQRTPYAVTDADFDAVLLNLLVEPLVDVRDT
jgi:hypothetical protein